MNEYDFNNKDEETGRTYEYDRIERRDVEYPIIVRSRRTSFWGRMKRTLLNKSFAGFCAGALIIGCLAGVGMNAGQKLSASLFSSEDEQIAAEVTMQEGVQPLAHVDTASDTLYEPVLSNGEITTDEAAPTAEDLIREVLAHLASSGAGVADIVEAASDSVVSINVKATVQSFFGDMEAAGAGSGIIVKEDDEKVYIVTNYHVIEGANNVTISLDDEQQFSASYVGGAQGADLAVISVSKSELKNAKVEYKIATFGDSDKIRIGDLAIAIGNALGEGKSATQGIISAKDRSITIDGKDLKVMQTDAAINPGNSGGALVNDKGEVIGINTAKLSSSDVEGMGYSIPANEAKVIIESLIANGSVKTPYFGTTKVITITEQHMRQYNFPSYGVYVNGVVTGSPAASAGIKQSDIITSFNGKQILTEEEFNEAVRNSVVGQTVKITLYRIYRNGSEQLTVDVMIEDLNSTKF